jgi:hypothetical protein
MPGENRAVRGMVGCRPITVDIGWNSNTSWFLRSMNAAEQMIASTIVSLLISFRHNRRPFEPFACRLQNAICADADGEQFTEFSLAH